MRISDWSSDVCSSDLPYTHRQVWRRSHDGRRAAVTGRNNAYERAARRSDVRFIDLTDYRAFREVGLRGLTVEGTERPGARDRNGARNALFADLLVTTGLRLEEASHLLAAAIPVCDARSERQRRGGIPGAPPQNRDTVLAGKGV